MEIPAPQQQAFKLTRRHSRCRVAQPARRATHLHTCERFHRPGQGKSTSKNIPSCHVRVAFPVSFARESRTMLVEDSGIWDRCTNTMLLREKIGG